MSRILHVYSHIQLKKIYVHGVWRNCCHSAMNGSVRFHTIRKIFFGIFSKRWWVCLNPPFSNEWKCGTVQIVKYFFAKVCFNKYDWFPESLVSRVFGFSSLWSLVSPSMVFRVSKVSFNSGFIPDLVSHRVFDFHLCFSRVFGLLCLWFFGKIWFLSVILWRNEKWSILLAKTFFRT